MPVFITAAVLREAGQLPRLEALTLEDPRPDEILVRIVATGLCQTDAHVCHRHIPTPMPVVLGHEGAGIVERVGQNVTAVAPGDHVVLSYNSCGSCERCLSGHPAYCDLMFPLNFGGARPDGSTALRDATGGSVHSHFFGQSSLATHALATERNVVKVPADLPLESLGALGCGVQTGAAAVLKAMAVPASASIAIFGVGAVGLSAVMAARVAGAVTIVALDVNPERLALAGELGATHQINLSDEPAAEALRRIIPGGFNYALDTSGRKESLIAGAAALAPLGTFGFVAYTPGSDAVVEASQFFMGKKLHGIIQGDADAKHFIPELIALYRSGMFPFDRLLRYYDFSQLSEAFADSAAGRTIKPILRMEGAAG